MRPDNIPQHPQSASSAARVIAMIALLAVPALATSATTTTVASEYAAAASETPSRGPSPASSLQSTKAATVSGVSVVKGASHTQAAPGSAIAYDIAWTQVSGTWGRPFTVTDVLTDGQTLLRGTIAGVNYEPLVWPGCQLLNVDGASGATSIALTVQSVAQRGETAPPPRCQIRFHAMTAAIPTVAHNVIPVNAVCNDDLTACNDQASVTTSVEPIAALSAQIEVDGTAIESIPTRLRLKLLNASALPLTAVEGVVTLPANASGRLLRVAPSPQLASTCGDAQIVAAPGTSSVSLVDGSVPGSADGQGAQSCEFSFDVVGAAGVYSISSQFGAKARLANGDSVATPEVQVSGAPLTLERSLNVDLSGAATRFQATTDGLIIMRYLFGLRGHALTDRALASDADRTDADEIAAHLLALTSKLDVDGDAQVNPGTDGLLLLRYLFGLRGDVLIADVVGIGATRSTAAAIEAWIGSLVP